MEPNSSPQRQTVEEGGHEDKCIPQAGAVGLGQRTREGGLGLGMAIVPWSTGDPVPPDPLSQLSPCPCLAGITENAG